MTREAEDRGLHRLPGAVQELANCLGVKPQDIPARVRLTQTGRMKPDISPGNWMAFTASQEIAVTTCEFDWRARAGPFGLIHGRDALAAGEGRFDIMALGFIPLARARHTPALVRGELIRYLAELAWAPDAICANPALRWRVEAANRLVVGAGAGSTAAEVTLTLDSDGRIATVYAPDRPRSATEPVLPTPWRGRFSDYRLHAGRWLPFAGEVGWEINGKEAVYWEGKIESWAIGAA